MLLSVIGLPSLSAHHLASNESPDRNMFWAPNHAHYFADLIKDIFVDVCCFPYGTFHLYMFIQFVLFKTVFGGDDEIHSISISQYIFCKNLTHT